MLPRRSPIQRSDVAADSFRRMDYRYVLKGQWHIGIFGNVFLGSWYRANDKAMPLMRLARAVATSSLPRGYRRVSCRCSAPMSVSVIIGHGVGHELALDWEMPQLVRFLSGRGVGG